MLEIGVVNLGLSPDEFWDLSWYEWGLYILREKHRAEENKFLFETGWEQTRQLWAIIINMNSSKKVKPSDLIKLSFDDKEQSKDFKPGEVVKKFKEKYGAGIR
jgi:hypothetical protein